MTRKENKNEKDKNKETKESKAKEQAIKQGPNHRIRDFNLAGSNGLHIQAKDLFNGSNFYRWLWAIS